MTATRNHLPERDIPKYIAECQNCHESLTIVYSNGEMNDEDFRDHLQHLMTLHLELEGHKPEDPNVIKKKWIHKIRPVDRERRNESQSKRLRARWRRQLQHVSQHLKPEQ